MSDPTWVHELRQELPTVRRCAYLNTGTAGPLPKCSHFAMVEESERELEEGRGNFALFDRFLARRERVRAAIAVLLQATPEEIALTHHTSEAVNIVLWGLDLRPGDRVVTTTLEHDAVAVPLGLLRDRHGVELRFVDVGLGERAVERLEAACSGGARLVVLSHVAYGTGALFPLAEMIEVAHCAGAVVLVDGAQSCGAMPVDVGALRADFYTVSGQKWLCGPEGCGALFVRADRLDEVHCTFSSYFSTTWHDYRGNLRLHPSAKRFEPGMIHRPVLAGFESSLEWMRDEVGIARAFDRSLDLAALGRQLLGAMGGVVLLTPEELQSQLLAFDLPDFSPAHLHAAALDLSREGIVIRSIDHAPYALRAAFGFFNIEEDARRLAEAIGALVKRGPATVHVGMTSLPTTR